MARSKREEGQRGERGRWRGRERDGYLLPPLPRQRALRVIPPSRAPPVFKTQMQQNAGRCHETSKWAILTSEGLQMLEELSASGRWD